MVDAFNDTSQNVLGTVRNTAVKQWTSDDTWKLVQERRNLKPIKLRKESIDNRMHYNYLCMEIKRRSQCEKVKGYLLTENLQWCGESTHMQNKTTTVCGRLQANRQPECALSKTEMEWC